MNKIKRFTDIYFINYILLGTVIPKRLKDNLITLPTFLEIWTLNIFSKLFSQAKIGTL